MNATLIPIQPSKRPLRRLAAGAFHPPSREIQPATTPLSPQTPSLPVPDPANDATREKQIPFRQTFLTDYHTITIGSGPNYLTDRGSTVGVSEMIIPSIWDPGNSKATEDWAFLRLNGRISSPSLNFRLGEVASDGDQLLLTSYSIPYSLAEGALPINGFVMSITGKFSNTSPASWNDSLYSTAEFDGSLLSGIETNGGSGGTVKRWNSVTNTYDAYGLTVASNFSAQVTFFLDFNAPGVEETIRAITNPASPAPAALACTVASGQAQLAMSNLVTNRAYRLMRSGTLAPSSWTQAHSFTATGPTATWSEPTAPEGRQFYRLEWTE